MAPTVNVQNVREFSRIEVESYQRRLLVLHLGFTQDFENGDDSNSSNTQSQVVYRRP